MMVIEVISLREGKFASQGDHSPYHTRDWEHNYPYGIVNAHDQFRSCEKFVGGVITVLIMLVKGPVTTSSVEITPVVKLHTEKSFLEAITHVMGVVTIPRHLITPWSLRKMKNKPMTPVLKTVTSFRDFIIPFMWSLRPWSHPWSSSQEPWRPISCLWWVSSIHNLNHDPSS